MNTIEQEGSKTIELIKEMYGTPIIILIEKTVHDIPAIVSKYGYDDYIAKPFQPIIVKEVIHNILERTHIHIHNLNCDECNSGGDHE